MNLIKNDELKLYVDRIFNKKMFLNNNSNFEFLVLNEKGFIVGRVYDGGEDYFTFDVKKDYLEELKIYDCSKSIHKSIYSCIKNSFNLHFKNISIEATSDLSIQLSLIA